MALWDYIESRKKRIKIIEENTEMKYIDEMKIRCYQDKTFNQKKINCEEKYTDYPKK
jgi:hypothetical protein